MPSPRRLTAALAAFSVTAVGAVAAVNLLSPTPAAALGNGLALTPPMGFNNWNSTQCRAEFNESTIKGIADSIVSSGLKAAGYEYVNLDDCWAEPQRAADGNLQPDGTRFPSGIKALADYVHAKGLKFGIYTSAGTMTCDPQGFPGALGNEQRDANLFASWGVDYLKYDNCNNQGVDARQRYTTMRDALKNTGRPIVYSVTEWGANKPWMWAPDVGNLWRTTYDITDTWSSFTGILHANEGLARFAGPGRWNDPDMLEVGNGGMTDAEYRSHFSLWAMMNAPLLIGTDVRTASAATLNTLKNTDVIALNQDSLGQPAVLVKRVNWRAVYAKKLANGDRAVALFNESGSTATISTTAAEIGLGTAPSYTVKDLWTKATSTSTGGITATVPAHGVVVYRITGGNGGTTTTTMSTLVGTGSSRCVDDPHGSLSDGQQFTLYDCHGDVNQQFTYTAARQLVVLGRCMDAYGQTPGSPVGLWECHGGGNQQWNINADGTISSAESGLCLDVANGATANGSQLIVWTCHGQVNQQWSRQ